MSSPHHRGPEQSPGRKRILACFEGHRTLFLYLYTDALSSSNSVSCHMGTMPRFMGCPNVEPRLHMGLVGSEGSMWGGAFLPKRGGVWGLHPSHEKMNFSLKTVMVNSEPTTLAGPA